METRFKDMLLQNEAKKRHLPPSLTSELQGATSEDGIPTYNKTRQLIVERLGGPFDYHQFGEEIRKIKVKRDQITRDFKRQTLQKPNLTSEDFGGKKAFYDFSTRPLEEPATGGQGSQENVSYNKPDYLGNLISEPPSFMI